MISTENLTNVNPFAVVLLLIVGVVVLGRSPQAAAIALLLAALLIPLGQQFVVAGLHVRFFRLLILVGFLRLVMRGELGRLPLTGIDRLFVACVLTGMVCGIIRGPKAETFGVVYDSLGTYFLLRYLLTDIGDVIGQLRFFAIVGVILACTMSYELWTGRNPLYVFGGVPEMTLVRDGRLRCQGPFRHPILAGTFAAALWPLLVGLWTQDRVHRPRATFGLIACAFCTFAAASSGAMLTLLGGMIGLALWAARDHLRLVRWTAVAAVAGLALVMKAPIWYLIARISTVTGGTGWHRSFLIDLGLEHFGDWWLFGFSQTIRWAPENWQGVYGLAVDPNNLDITNHYLEQGLSGGVLQLGFFLAVIAVCFRTIGRCLRIEGVLRLLPLEPKLMWALGACLGAHCTAFISVTYFDQIQVFWLWLLVVISALSSVCSQTEAAVEESECEVDAMEEGAVASALSR